MKWYWWGIISIALVLYFFFNNLILKLRTIHLLEEYKKYIDEPNFKFLEIKSRIQKILTNAGIDEILLPAAQPVGYGKLVTFKFSALQNLESRRQDVAIMVISAFHEAIGVYHDRMIASINPINWIKVIIFLPKHALSYIGVTPDKVITKIFQIIYWIIMFVITIFEMEIIQRIKDILGL
jgi:hypothetical protein